METATSLRAETSPVRTGHEIDQGRLFEYLAENVPGFHEPASLRQFRGGQSNPTYMIASGDRMWVMRKKPPGQLLPSAHQVEREYRVMKALSGSAVPVPKMVHLCENDAIVGTSFYVMEGIEGRVFRDLTLPGLALAERSKIYEVMVGTLAALHAVDWRAVGLESFGRPTGYVARQVARWSAQYRASKTAEIASMDSVMAWLGKHVPQDDEAAIAHGDFRLENMILHPDEPKVLAVIDWELATIGHPLSDLAYNCLPYHVPPDVPGIGGLRDNDPAATGIPDEGRYIAAYCALTGRRAIDDWQYYLAFSLFRTAAILQGVHARALQKTASSENALSVGKLAAQIADLAWQAAQRGGRQ
jgi:aminoglycoside phosphotransferase (APT) family kinase protein